MQRPDVRIIDNQQVSDSTPNIDQSEAEYLLAKYGYKVQVDNNHRLTQNPMTFDEMINKQEREEERYRRPNGPKPISFDDRNVSYSETKYSDLDIDGGKLGIKVQIVTDMRIN